MSEAQAVQQITWIYTYNLAKTALFYSDILGLDQVLDQGICRVFKVSATGFIGVCQRPDRDVEPKGVIFTMLTPDIDAWYKKLKDAGADVMTEPGYSTNAKAYAFFCRDPEGYRIEFQWFDDPRWQYPEGRMVPTGG